MEVFDGTITAEDLNTNFVNQMTPTQYSEWRRAMDFYPKNEGTLAFHTLGLAGESGEVAEKVKKHYRDDVLVPEAVALELGDALWYLTGVADDLGYTLQDIIDLNVKKLEDRQARGVHRGSGDSR